MNPNLGSFPLTATVTTLGYRSYKSPLNKAPLSTVTGRGDDTAQNLNSKACAAKKVAMIRQGHDRFVVFFFRFDLLLKVSTARHQGLACVQFRIEGDLGLCSGPSVWGSTVEEILHVLCSSMKGLCNFTARAEVPHKGRSMLYMPEEYRKGSLIPRASRDFSKLHREGIPGCDTRTLNSKPHTLKPNPKP